MTDGYRWKNTDLHMRDVYYQRKIKIYYLLINLIWLFIECTEYFPVILL